jgi:hypothetical protein
VTTILNAQAARGARADATLYRHHFEGTALNALGRSKLDLMLEDNSTAFPMTVYLDMAGESSAEGRTEAVREYLVAAGLTASQVKTELGPNPGTLRPAGPQIKRLNAMEDERTRGQKEQADVAAIVAPLMGEKK